MDLPRFRGEVRSWDQGTWFDCIVSSLDHPMGSDRRPELGGDLSGRYTGDVAHYPRHQRIRRCRCGSEESSCVSKTAPAGTPASPSIFMTAESRVKFFGSAVFRMRRAETTRPTSGPSVRFQTSPLSQP
jgi:hypothetical protein